jgi:hypothetical protein
MLFIAGAYRGAAGLVTNGSDGGRLVIRGGCGRLEFTL